MKAFVVTTRPDELDVASEVLWGLGVRAVEERTIDDSTIELWTVVGDNAASIEHAAAHIDPRWRWRTVEVDEAAADTWRDFARPVRIDDTLVIVPAWQDPASFVNDDSVTAVTIEPGSAFGLGDHPTTRLALGALRRLDIAGRSVLDVGCGTGVIGVTAAVLGATEVRAVDIASAAVEATIDNAMRNGVAATVIADATPAATLTGRYDIVVANILAPTLIELAPDLVRLTRGRLVISGILADAHAHVAAALRPLKVECTDVLDGWAGLTLTHV